jgi:hypothetical protein
MNHGYPNHELVVCLEHGFYFPICWEKSSQLTFIFFQMVKTTNQMNLYDVGTRWIAKLILNYNNYSRIYGGDIELVRWGYKQTYPLVN